MNFLKAIRTLILSVLSLAVTIAIFYGIYWITKTVSYEFFYKDMVLNTIHENIAQHCILH